MWSPDLDEHPDHWPWRNVRMKAWTTNDTEPTVRIRCLRAKFLIAGKIAIVGETYSLPMGDAGRLVAAGVAEFA